MRVKQVVFVFISVLVSACAVTKPEDPTKFGSFSFNYRVSNQEETGLVLVYNDAKRTYLQVPKVKARALKVDIGGKVQKGALKSEGGALYSLEGTPERFSLLNGKKRTEIEKLPEKANS